MKTRFVLAGLVATMMVLEVSAQREYDDMYFRGKDREKNKAIAAEEVVKPVKKQKQTSADEASDEDYYANPTDSYSARNVNPEYVSRSNSEQASDDEANYYSEDYQPAGSDYNYNNSYYNNANWANNSFYANSMWGRPYGMYGMGYYDPWMSPYGGFGYNDPWMTPYAMGPGYGWGSRWSISFGYGNYWGPAYGYGMGMGYGYPYYGYGSYGYGGYGYPNYYYGSGGYYEGGRNVTMGKRPSRHSAVVQPTQQSRNRQQVADNGNNSNTVTQRGRARQSQDEYYVRPSRRTSNTTPSFDNTSSPNSRPSRYENGQTMRSPGGNNSSQTPSYTPSSSPSRSSSGGSSGGSRSSGGSSGGGSRPRGRG